MVLYIIVGILLFGLLIAVHEGGHFLAAKRLDVQVNEFSIGMGPAIFSRQKGETLYSLRAFPIGGYCAMEGEDEDSKNPRAFSRKAAWRKLIILAAGSVMNFVAGFVLVAILFGVAGSYTVPVIRDFAEGFAYAGEDGLQRGDRFLSINGHKVTVYSDVSTQFSAAQGGTMDLVVERNGEAVTLEDFPLHLGVTEAGTTHMGTLKAAAGIGGLLALGIGDTLRVTLTADPVEEVYAARDILKAIGLRREGPDLIACPTCGRTKIDLIPLAQAVEERLKTVTKPITVAVMGCPVNGPGEAAAADVGIAGGNGKGLLFRHGKVVKQVPQEAMVEELMALIETL